MIIEGPDGKDRNTHRGMDAGRVVTFHNVTIAIADARNAGDAYDLLCMALATMEEHDGITVEWTTDTYTTGDVAGARPTNGLFPAEGSTRERKGRA
jgi:hypothetical protein